MENTYAIVVDEVVTNVIVWDGDTETWAPPDGAVMVKIEPGMVPHIGLGYRDGVFEQP